MAQSSVERPEDAISELFQNEKIKTIVLYGKPGIGKTWLARKASVQAVKEKIFDFVLWVYLNQIYDESSLGKSIAHQLCLPFGFKEWEVDDSKEFDEEDAVEDMGVLKSQISMLLEGKSLLLVLDDEGKKMNEEEIMGPLHFVQHYLSKLLITSVNEDDRHQSSETKTIITMMPFSVEKSSSLLRQRVGAKMLEIPGMQQLAEDFAERNGGLIPASIVMLSKALICSKKDSGVQALEFSLEESSGDGSFNFSQLLNSGYNDVPDGILIDCSFVGSHFYIDHGPTHYSEFIAYWILEGYFGHIECVEDAYEKGHHVLMELLDCQILKNVEADYIVMERTKLDLIDRLTCGFSATARLGLGTLFEDGTWGGLGKVTLADGMIRTLRSGKKETIHSTTLLIDGNRLSREVTNGFFQSNQDLEVLALFNPLLKSLPPSLSSMKELTVLVFRGCDLLVNIECIRELQKLIALEISGARSLKNIPDDVFMLMTNLKSLNLSALQVETLPSSVYHLTELQRVVLTECSNLKTLQSFKKSERLTVLDLSGATSLESFPERNIKTWPKLQHLDLSRTKIKSIPFLHGVRDLTYLSFSSCQHVGWLPSIASLANLRILDLSGARIKEFRDQSLDCNSVLQTLDLSRTPISRLPSKISNLRHLILKHCDQFQKLTCIKGLAGLKTLDVSGSSNLGEIEDGFFEDLKDLFVVNLSETAIKGLPALTSLSGLHQLLLSNCSSLEKLPNLNSLIKLEVLDLSGCSSLTVIEGETFEHMSRLRKLCLCETKISTLPSLLNLMNLRHLLLMNCTKLSLEIEQLKTLSNLEELNLCGVGSFTEAHFLVCMSKLQSLDLSETLLKQLPSMSNLKNLSHLSLKNCLQLESVSPLEELTKLEVLDISGTSVRHLPCLSNCKKLRRLMVRNCLSLEESIDLQIPDATGAIVKDLPQGIAELTQLEHLDLPNMIIQGVDDRDALPEEPNQYRWAISSFPSAGPQFNKPIFALNGSEFIHLLEKNPSIWETSFTQFQFIVLPIKENIEIGGSRGIYIYEDELIFRDIYFQDRHFFNFKDKGRVVEISGFQYFPRGIEHVISHAEYVFVSESSFISQISDLGVHNIILMKGCWIERCELLETVFNLEDAEEVTKLGNNLETLWVRNAINMKSICRGNLQHQGFENLKCLFLDCCPKLSTVFSSAVQPKNLEVLHVKFCDQLKTLFEHTSQVASLPRLHTLILWDLPELQSTLCMFPSINNLEVGGCPMLSNVFSAALLPTELKILKIKFCENLETVFENSTTGEDHTLLEVHTLHLSELPELKRIGVQLPSVRDSNVRHCPKLELVPGA